MTWHEPCDASAMSKETVEGGSLSVALHQSERVQEKVEDAAVELSAVNGVLLNTDAPVAKIELALVESEAVQVKLSDAAAELQAVNGALAREIETRHRLERELVAVDAALVESRAEEREASHRALHDAMTGLPNLRMFGERLTDAIAQAHRREQRLAVMFIDLDQFKAINDTRGHEFGDRVLRIVAQRLRSIVRAGDTVSRRSGDEFLFLMLEADDEAGVRAFAARIAASVAAPFDVDGASLHVTASVGFAIYPDHGANADALLERADSSMLAAKRSSRPPAS